MRLFKFLLRYSPRFLIVAVAAGIISGATNTTMIALVNYALGNHGLSAKALAGYFAALCLLYVLTRITAELLLINLGQGAVLKLRMNLSREVFAIPLRKLEEIGGHRIVTLLNDDIPAIAAAINALPIVCINTAVVIACLVYLGWLSLGVLITVLLLLLVGAIGYQMTVGKAFASIRLARMKGEELHKHFRAITDGMKEFKLHYPKREAFLSQVLQTTATDFRSYNTKGLSLYSIAASWGQAWVFVVIGLIIFGAPHLLTLRVQTLFAYAMVVLYMMSPLQVIMNILPGLARASVSLKRLEEMGLALKANSTESGIWHNLDPAPSWGILELVAVTHTYRREGEESDFTLGPVDLTLKPGELVFLAGGNGSGKTTFAKLLTGLYSPESGEIRLDGQLITDNNKEYYRQHFSAVFSDFYLLESLLGLDGPDIDSQARQYLLKLQLSNKVHVDKGAFSTTDLSQGQRKRLALLTAYLEDRPIYVFDEWAADQDPFFKDVFYYELLPELKARGKTVLVISHDDRYYHIADSILKLEYGKVCYYEPTNHPAYENVLEVSDTAPG